MNNDASSLLSEGWLHSHLQHLGLGEPADEVDVLHGVLLKEFSYFLNDFANDVLEEMLDL